MFSNDLLTENLCTQGYHLIDNFLPEKYAQQLRAIAENHRQQGSFEQAKIGRTLQTQQNKQIRSDEICWLDKFKGQQSVDHFLSIIAEMMQTLNQNLFLSLHEFESHFAIYQPGTFYKKHVDQFHSTKNRKISCVYYLNENWQEAFGGDLKLYSQNDILLQEVMPIGNRFICFNSELPHEVKLTQKTRYSIAGWMKTRTA